MDMLYKIWEAFNGNKTAIGVVLYVLAHYMNAAGYVEHSGTLTEMAWGFLGVGVAHKMSKM